MKHHFILWVTHFTLVLFSAVTVFGDDAVEVDFKLSFDSTHGQRSVTVDWDVAGTLEYATTFGRWKKSTNSTTLFRTGRRSATFEYPSSTFPPQMYFRLLLPEHHDDPDEHPHLYVESTDPFLAGQTVQPVNPAWQISRPQPVYNIRLHLVRCADTFGANRVAITTNEFQQYVDQANTIFFRSGIHFDWDPVADVEDINNSALNSEVTLLVPASSLTNRYEEPQEGVHYTKTNNSAARTTFSLGRKGKLVVFAAHFGSLTDHEFYWDNTNRWRVKVLDGGYSGWAGQHVTLPGTLKGLHLLAHEVGHYLNNMHTFSAPDTDNDNVAGELTDIKNYIQNKLYDGDVSPADVVSLFDGDGYWVRDTPADPGVRCMRQLNNDDPCADNLNGNVSVSVALGGVYPGNYTFSFAPNRLNIQSYFRCTNIGVMYQSKDQIARTRDALENRHRHHLIARHVGLVHGTQLNQTDLYESGTPSHAAMQLVRMRYDQMALVRRRTSDDAFQLFSLTVDDQGALTTRYLATGAPCLSVKAVNMGLGLLAVGYITTDNRPAVSVYRLSETNTWTLEDTWSWLQTDVREIALERFGRLNLALACRTSDFTDNTGIYCLLVNADGSIQWQSYNEIGTSTSIALAPGGSRPLAVCRRDGDGDLLLETWKLTDERASGATLERIDAASAGAINKAALLMMDSDHVVTPIATSSGDLKLISWNIDYSGNITRMGNGLTVTNRAVWESARFSTDLVAVSARTDTGGMSVHLYETDSAGNFTSVQSNSSQILAVSGAAQPACTLIRDQHLAVARLASDGTPEIRIYSAPF
jgi:hypothetical protein